jgi:hypothetical protein
MLAALVSLLPAGSLRPATGWRELETSSAGRFESVSVEGFAGLLGDVLEVVPCELERES